MIGSLMVAVVSNSTAVSGGLPVSPEFYALTVSAVVGAVVAVIATFGVQYYLDRPKVRGIILTYITATMGAKFEDVRGEFKGTIVFPFVLLTNQHRNAVSMLDFMLEVDFGKGWHKMERLITDEQWKKETLPKALVFDAGDRIMRFPNIDKALLERKLRPIKFGDYLDGFLLFASKTAFLGKDVKRLRLSCIDVFENGGIGWQTKNESAGGSARGHEVSALAGKFLRLTQALF